MKRHNVTHVDEASTSRIVCKRTLAPFAQSRQLVNSFGEWLIPSTLGTKIIPMGPTFASICASCPAPLGKRMVRSPKPAAAASIFSWISGAATAGGSCYSVDDDFCSSFLGDFLRPLLD